MHTLERKYRLVSAPQSLSSMVAVEQQRSCYTKRASEFPGPCHEGQADDGRE